MGKRGKWNAQCRDLFDATRQVAGYTIEVHAWSWVNDDEADVVWTAAGLLRWGVYEGAPVVLNAPVVEQGLEPFDLENGNESDMLVEVVHKFEGLVASYEQIERLLAEKAAGSRTDGTDRPAGDEAAQ